MKNLISQPFLTIIVLSFQLVLRGYAQIPDSIDSTQKGIENVWRTSDLDGEQPVLHTQRKAKRIDGSALLPEGSQRVGCVCMDYIAQQRIGSGACNGHNGVRFWLYELPSGDTVKIPTLRHEAHPDTLTDAALMQLAAFKRYERLMTQKQLDFFKTLEEHPDWLNPNMGFASPNMDWVGDSAAFNKPFIMPMPPTNSPIDHAATDTLLYSLSVLLGSGALAVLKKVFKSNTDTTEQHDETTPLIPQNTIETDTQNDSNHLI